MELDTEIVVTATALIERGTDEDGVRRGKLWAIAAEPAAAEVKRKNDEFCREIARQQELLRRQWRMGQSIGRVLWWCMFVGTAALVVWCAVR